MRKGKRDKNDKRNIPAPFFLTSSLHSFPDIIRIAYAWFIEWDYQMHDPVTDTPAEATSTALAEDLGQIQYIFSDKTGTLTENKMVFLKCAVNNRVYGNTADHPTALGDPNLSAAIRAGDGPVVQFFRTLAVCHSVVPSLNSQNQPVYKASSPDEKALVEAATAMHVKLLRRTPMLELEMPNGASEFWEPLYSLDFTPERKRMSVLLRHRDSHEVVLFTKGADDRVVPLLAPGQGVEQTLQAMESFARLGLRTLCVA
jgi:phospholipid-translocating ATPase